MLPALSLCALFLPIHTGTDSTLMYSTHRSVDSVAGECWEAGLVFPQQVGMKYLHFGKCHYIRCEEGGSL